MRLHIIVARILWRRQWRLREEMALAGSASEVNAEVRAVLQAFSKSNLVNGGNMY